MEWNESLAHRVVKKMMDSDWFSQWLEIEILELEAGRCKLACKVTHAMLNGFAIAHGGISYSLADSALAFASNSHGIKAMSIETTISHTRMMNEGDVLTATTEEKTCGKNTAIYHITVTNQDGKTCALFKGIVFRTGENWFND
ncbi:MAG: hotdog fold thioesterase [Bacteroidetes bacterium]|nr:hotdog fold thioesterase [Bacteroidota bacterium]